jgi:hypothetical protein
MDTKVLSEKSCQENTPIKPEEGIIKYDALI